MSPIKRVRNSVLIEDISTANVLESSVLVPTVAVSATGAVIVVEIGDTEFSIWFTAAFDCCCGDDAGDDTTEDVLVVEEEELKFVVVDSLLLFIFLFFEVFSSSSSVNVPNICSILFNLVSNTSI
jgi:hypothetical protein